MPEKKKKGIPLKKGQKQAKHKLVSCFDLPDDAKSLEMTFVGLLAGEDGLYYTLRGKLHLGKGIVLTCDYDKADLIELGLDRAETHLMIANSRDQYGKLEDYH